MSRRLLRTSIALLFVIAATALQGIPPRGECYPGGVYTAPEGYPECFPGAGNNCLYCEF